MSETGEATYLSMRSPPSKRETERRRIYVNENAPLPRKLTPLPPIPKLPLPPVPAIHSASKPFSDRGGDDDRRDDQVKKDDDPYEEFQSLTGHEPRNDGEASFSRLDEALREMELFVTSSSSSTSFSSSTIPLPPPPEQTPNARDSVILAPLPPPPPPLKTQEALRTIKQAKKTSSNSRSATPSVKPPPVLGGVQYTPISFSFASDFSESSDDSTLPPDSTVSFLSDPPIFRIGDTTVTDCNYLTEDDCNRKYKDDQISESRPNDETTTKKQLPAFDDSHDYAVPRVPPASPWCYGVLSNRSVAAKVALACSTIVFSIILGAIAVSLWKFDVAFHPDNTNATAERFSPTTAPTPVTDAFLRVVPDTNGSTKNGPNQRTANEDKWLANYNPKSGWSDRLNETKLPLTVSGRDLKQGRITAMTEKILRNRSNMTRDVRLYGRLSLADYDDHLNLDYFPGYIDRMKVRRPSNTVTYIIDTHNLPNGRIQWYPTEIYMAAAEVVTVTTAFTYTRKPSSTTRIAPTVRLRIGPYTEFSTNVTKPNITLERYPSGYDTFPLSWGTQKLVSQMGGIIIFEMVPDPRDMINTVTVQIERHGLYNTPYYRYNPSGYGTTSRSQWRQQEVAVHSLTKPERMVDVNDREATFPFVVLEKGNTVIVWRKSKVTGRHPRSTLAQTVDSAFKSTGQCLYANSLHEWRERIWYVNDRQALSRDGERVGSNDDEYSVTSLNGDGPVIVRIRDTDSFYAESPTLHLAVTHAAFLTATESDVSPFWIFSPEEWSFLFAVGRCYNQQTGFPKTGYEYVDRTARVKFPSTPSTLRDVETNANIERGRSNYDYDTRHRARELLLASVDSYVAREVEEIVRSLGQSRNRISFFSEDVPMVRSAFMIDFFTFSFHFDAETIRKCLKKIHYYFHCNWNGEWTKREMPKFGEEKMWVNRQPFVQLFKRRMWQVLVSCIDDYPEDTILTVDKDFVRRQVTKFVKKWGLGY